MEAKTFHETRRGRINGRREARKRQVLIKNLERRYAKQLTTLFRKFMNTELYLFREFGVWDPVVAREHLDEDFIPLTLTYFRKLFKATWDLENSNYMQRKQEAVSVAVFDRQQDIVDLVDRYFNNRSLILAGVTSQMSSKIDKIIQSGRLEGLSNQDIARNITNSFPSILRFRANLIARTETHNAVGFAADIYYEALGKQTGIKLKKKWIAVSDDRTRSAHSEVNGTIIDNDENFIVGGAEMKYAGDPAGGLKNTINCRCTVIYADARDIVD